MAAQNNTDDSVTITLTAEQAGALHVTLAGYLPSLYEEVEYARKTAERYAGTRGGRDSEKYADRVAHRIEKLEEVRTRLNRG